MSTGTLDFVAQNCQKEHKVKQVKKNRRRNLEDFAVVTVAGNCCCSVIINIKLLYLIMLGAKKVIADFRLITTELVFRVYIGANAKRSGCHMWAMSDMRRFCSLHVASLKCLNMKFTPG